MRPPLNLPRLLRLLLVGCCALAAAGCEPASPDAGPSADAGPWDGGLDGALDGAPETDGAGPLDVSDAHARDGASDPLKAFEAPVGWHHAAGNSRNTRCRGAIPSPPTLRPAWGDGLAAPDPLGCGFTGAVAAPGGLVLTTAAGADGATLLAVGADAGSLRWTFELDSFGALGGLIVDPEGQVFVADDAALYGLRPRATGPPEVLWKEPHAAWAPWIGFGPLGEVVEVTAAGTVRVHSRTRGLRAAAALPLDGALPRPPGLGLPLGLQHSAALVELARSAGSVCRAADDGVRPDAFVVPAHLEHLRASLGSVGGVDAPPAVAMAALQGGLGLGVITGGAALTALPTEPGGPLSESYARIFVPTLGAYHPPEDPALSPALQAFDDETLEELFLAKLPPEQRPAALRRLRTAGPDADGAYARDPNPERRCVAPDDQAPHLLPLLGAPSGKPPQPLADLAQGTARERDAAWLRTVEMRADFLRLSRGWYEGLLWPVDWDPRTDTLTVGEPWPLPAPAIGPPVVSSASSRADGMPVVFVPLPDRIVAFEAGARGQPARGPRWTWTAGLAIGPGLLGLAPEEFGQAAGSGPGVAVSAGPRGLVLVQDRSLAPGKPPDDPGCSSDLCRTVYTLSPLPLDLSAGPEQSSRAARYRAGAAVELAWPVALPAAGQKYGYLVFGLGEVSADPLADPLGELLGASSASSARLCVLSLRAGHLLQCLPLDDSGGGAAALGHDGAVLFRRAGLRQGVARLLDPTIDAPPRCGLLRAGAAP